MDLITDYRRFFLKIDEVRSHDRTVIATLSTENVVWRMQGGEVLLHTSAAVDLSREPIPLITSHQADTQTPVGVAQNLRIVNRKLKADLKFGRSQRAQELWQDVQDGIARHLSIGYAVLEKEDPDRNGRYLVTRWMPLEASIVAVPADHDAVIGRSHEFIGRETKTQKGEAKKMRKFFEGKDDGGRAAENYLKTGSTLNRHEWYNAILQSGMTSDQKIIEPHPALTREASGLGEGVAVDGGFLVPSPLASEVLYNKFASKLIPKCNTLAVSFNTMNFPRLDDSERSDSLFRNVQVYQVAEAGGLSPNYSTVAVNASRLSMKKTGILCAVTDDLRQDVTAMDKFLPDALAKALAFDQDRQLIRGSGVGEWLGLTSHDGRIAVDKESGQSAGTLLLENVIKMIARLPAEAHGDPSTVWIASPSAYEQILNMVVAVGTGGSSTGLWRWKSGDEEFNRLAGFPLIPNEHASPIGTEGDLILAQLSRFQILIRAIRQQISLHLLFLSDESVFRLILRSDGQPDFAKAITPAQGTDLVSPIVTLKTRS